MPRRRPSRLRAGAQPSDSAVIPGVPLATSRALDRLGRPDVSSVRVRTALEVWQQTAALPRTELSKQHSDWTAFVGPQAREDLERALLALSPRRAVPLRRVVERADREFDAKTLNNPRADPSAPWWARRWWH